MKFVFLFKLVLIRKTLFILILFSSILSQISQPDWDSTLGGHHRFKCESPCKSPLLTPSIPVLRLLVALRPQTSVAHSVSWNSQPPPTMTPLMTLTSLINRPKKPLRDSLTISKMGSMSYLKKMPGTTLAGTSRLWLVAAYWLVKMLLESARLCGCGTW